MIHLLPYLKEQINSKRRPADIYMILESVTDSREDVFFTDAAFIGQVHALDFRIVPGTKYRNPFRPVIMGSMAENNGGTTIDITLQMHLLTRIFLTFWFGNACFFFLCGILVVFKGGLEEMALILVSLGFIICGQVLIRCGFYGSAGKALKRLKELLC